MKQNNNIEFLIWNIKQAIFKKKSNFFLLNFNQLENILTLLYIEGLISGFKKIHLNSLNKKDFFLIHLNLTVNGKSNFSNISQINLNSRDFILRIQEIAAQIQNEPFTIGVIRTAKYGIITTKTAYKYKCGGTYLFKIK